MHDGFWAEGRDRPTERHGVYINATQQEGTVSQQTGSPVPRDPREIQAVRDTVAEWMRHHADRIESGKYMRDLGGGVVLTEPEVRSLVMDLQRICGAAAVGMDSSAEDEELRECMRAAEHLSADLADELLAKANLSRTKDMLNAAPEFGDQAREKGREAVKEKTDTGAGEIGPPSRTAGKTMISATAAPPESTEIFSPGFKWAPDQIPFAAHMGHALLRSVIASIHRHAPVAEVTTDNPARRFITLLTEADQQLERVQWEGGPNVEEDAMRAALPKLEEAAELRGHPNAVDRFTKMVGDGEIREPLATIVHAAGYVLDWALAGCRARLAELE